MNQERYHQIEALAEAALKLEGSRRSEFLQRACGSDQDLLQRVTALVKSYEASGEFLEQPAFESWARDVAQSSVKQSLSGCDLGRFVVLEKLGAGGIGEVWLAKDKQLARDVALKFLTPELAGGSDQARRFQQEARAASALNHPNLVTIFDVGEFQGRQFIAQEYVPGQTVRELLRSGPLGTEGVIDIAVKIAAGLRAAHAAGVVHRDIKPENVMVRPDGVVKILDFGIARFVENATTSNRGFSTLTRPGFVLGTVRYMSPEQARGLPVDGRSDIFSFGVVLYEMLTGTAPFTGDTPSDVIAAILTKDPAPLSRSTRDVPAEFESIVRRCLAKDPAERYPSAAALHEDLDRVAAKQKQTSSLLTHWLYVGVGILAIAAIAVAIVLHMRREPASQFSSMKITRLATRGEVADLTIARDGTLLAYVAGEGMGQDIWIRDFSGANERVAVTVESAELSGVMFSPDDSFLYYRRRGAGEIGDLYRVSVKGGAPQRVIGDVSGTAAISPDGQHIAFIRLKPSNWEASLVISNADGSGESTLQTLRRPQFFDEHSVAWSPDSQVVACFAGEAVQWADAAIKLVGVNIRHPSRRLITSQSWMWPHGLAWSARQDALIVIAKTAGDIDQLWMVRPKSGEVTRLTNDLSNYRSIALTDDGKSLVAVQRQTAIAVWTGAANDGDHFTRATSTPLSSARTSISWTPDGQLVYNEGTEGYRDLWMVSPDGKNPRRLTSSPGNKDEFVVSRDGRYIVYQQDGHIWRVKADGTEPQQLTSGPLDVHPDISPDGNSVVYASFVNWAPGIGGQPTLWRVAINGHNPNELSRQPASFPRHSPTGEQLACVHYPEKDPRFSNELLATLKADGSGGFTVFQTSPSDETSIAWSAEGNAVDYILNSNGVGNVWRKPLSGGLPYQITHFDRDELFSFSRSSDGRLACARGTTTPGAILIQGLK